MMKKVKLNNINDDDDEYHIHEERNTKTFFISSALNLDKSLSFPFTQQGFFVLYLNILQISCEALTSMIMTRMEKSKNVTKIFNSQTNCAAAAKLN